MPRLFTMPLAQMLILCLALGATGSFVAGCSSRDERAQAYYERAKVYLDQKDTGKARIELRNALQLKNDLLPAWKALAEIDEHDQNLQGLLGDLRRVTEIDSSDFDATFKLARLYLLGNALDPALKLANTASDLMPKDADVMALKAAILYKLKDNDGATKNAKEAIAIDPVNTGANSILAAIKLSEDDPNGALKMLSNIGKEHQDDLGVAYLKINIYTKLNKSDEVEAVLRRQIELNPKVPGFRTELVRFYLRSKRPDDAVKELRSVVTADPTDVNSELQLVSLLGTIKGADAARAELVARINGSGNVFPYRVALAKFDFAEGRGDDSVKQLDTLISGAASPEDKLTAQTTLAEIYIARNNYTAAEPLITDILKADSHNTTGLRLRASIHLDRSQTDDAIADLRSALNYQPRSPELLASLAIAYERAGSIELADKAFFDATKASNYAPGVGLNYVAFLRRRGMNSQAENIINELAGRNQNSVPVLTALAQVKLSHQDWVGAHAVANAIHQINANSEVADQINAAAFNGQGKISDSLAVLQNAYQANPGAVRPMVDLVSAYLRSGQVAQANSFIRSALKDNPDNAEALVLLGTLQVLQKAPADAERSFKAAIEKKPNDASGYRALAEFYAREKRIDDAQTVTREGLKHDSGNFGLRLLDAGILEAKGDFEDAIAAYETMLKNQPASLIVANNLASLLADHRIDKASLERAGQLATVLKSSQIPQFKDTLGWVSYQRQDYRSALTLLEEAAKSLPNVALVQYHLGMAYLATGQDEKAQNQFKRAQTLAPADTELRSKIDSALKSRPGKQPS